MSKIEKLTAKGFFIWFLCAIFFMYEFLLRTVIGTFQHPIMHDLALTSFTFALLSSTAYLITYGIMQVPVGLIADKYGLKKALSVAIVICAVSTLGFAFSHHLNTAIVFRVFTGFGSAFGFVCLLVAVYDWMPRKNIALFIGLSQFIGTMGPMLAAGPLDALSHSSGSDWRYVFYILALAGLCLSVAVFLFVEDNRHMHGKFIVLSRPEKVMDNLRRLLSQKQTWYIALYSALVYFTIEYLSETEGKAFLMLNGFCANFASYMITCAWIGYAIGCPLLGFISDKIQKRKPLLIVSGVCAFLSMITIVYFPVAVWLVIVSFFLLGIGAAGQSIGFAIMAEQCKESYLAAGLGLNNMAITVVSAFNAPIIGWILANLAQKHGNKLQLHDYHYAFSIIIVLIGLGLFTAVFLIRETFCKNIRENTVLTLNVDRAVPDI